MRKLFIVVALVATLVPAAASAAPPAGSVPMHQHYVVTGTGALVPVGPSACTNGQSLQFDKFHHNVHQGSPGGLGVVTATGC